MIGIYKIQNKISGKLYIGSSYNIRERIINHKSMLRCNKHHSIHLQRAYNKYGINNFIFEILEECDINDLMVKEQYYIDKYDFNNLYNILPKSSPGFTKKHKRSSIIKSQRSRGYSSIYEVDYNGKIINEFDLISDINHNSCNIYNSIKKEQCLKNKDFGFIYSKDYKKGFKPKLFKSWNKGKTYKHTNVNSYKIYVYDIYGRAYKEFNSLRDCAIEMNIEVSNLHRYLNNNNVRNRKYLFFTKPQIFNNIVYFEKNKDNNTIEVFTVFNESLGYSTPKKVSSILNINNSSIYQILNNQRIQCKGYKFQIL